MPRAAFASGCRMPAGAEGRAPLSRLQALCKGVSLGLQGRASAMVSRLCWMAKLETIPSHSKSLRSPAISVSTRISGYLMGQASGDT